MVNNFYSPPPIPFGDGGQIFGPKTPLRAARGLRSLCAFCQASLPKFTVLILLILSQFVFASILRTVGNLPSDISLYRLETRMYEINTVLQPGRLAMIRPVTITYCASTDPVGRASGLPEWGGGGTRSGDEIVVFTDAKPFLQMNAEQTTIHELVHASIIQITENTPLPRWFHEGVAMTLAGEIAFNELFVIARASAFGGLAAYSSIDSVNYFSQSRAELMYAQSHQAVLFMVQTYGLSSLGDLCVATRKTGSFESAVVQVIGITKEQLLIAFKNDLAKRYGLLFFAGDDTIVWVGIVILFMVAFGITLWRNKKKKQKMEESELLEAQMEADKEVLEQDHETGIDEQAPASEEMEDPKLT